MSTLKLNRHPGPQRAAEGDTVTAERDPAQHDEDDVTPTPAPAQGSASNGAIEGEGSYTAAAQYNRDVQAFVESHDVEAAAREAAPATPEEASQLANAENKGRSRSRGEDGQQQRRRGRFLRRRR
jgi:hypothetical protein